MSEEKKTTEAVTSDVVLQGATFKLSHSDEPARFVLGLRKSGSTLLNRIMTMVSKRTGLHTIDLAHTFFNNGLKMNDWQDTDLSSVIKRGNMYLGFRGLPNSLGKLEVFRDARKVFMFRDPRDALVSQYFSDAYSHSLPSAKTESAEAGVKEFMAKRERALAMDINDYVIKQAPSMDRTFMAYAEVLGSELTLPLRYEEYIFTKKRMMRKILKHFDLEMNNAGIESILAVVDIVPESEDAKKFVRNVVPGDHRRKLKPETIAKLDRLLQASLTRFDYY